MVSTVAVFGVNGCSSLKRLHGGGGQFNLTARQSMVKVDVAESIGGLSEKGTLWSL